MYGLLWRALPGPLAVRLALVVLLAAGAVVACFGWLFPLLAPLVPVNQTTVHGSAP